MRIYYGTTILGNCSAFFPKQCGHTEGVLTVSVKARCSIEVVSVASGIFPVNFYATCIL